MLVDNSIVVIENTFRLRRMGVPAKKAAVARLNRYRRYSLFNADYGLRVCSYSICSEGITRETVYRYGSDHNIFALASLVIALTLVPAMSSMMFRNEMKPEIRRFQERIYEIAVMESQT